MKVFLSTLGCKLNESELEAWTRKFANDGHEIVASPIDADICVLNTCTVTHVAARKSRQAARQIARANPNARLVLTGCYASIAPDEAKRLPNVALVVPNAEKDNLVSLASGIMPMADCTASAIDDHYGISAQTPAISQSRTRAFVKIQDGCNMSCTYCIIPLARGKERSRPLPEIVAEVESLVAAGYKEIILTGVQISEYRDHSTHLFVLRDLVGAILGETAVPRLRLTSIAPWDLDAQLLALFTDPRLCRHLHLSLQSGSDSVLRRMRRPYTTEQFTHAVDLAREKIPDVGITTDVIVGFPGESDIEFEQSQEFVERTQFSRVHVFPYSARTGTIAACLPLHVSDTVKEKRAKRMQAVADNSVRAFAQRFVGRAMPVLWEASEGSERKREDPNPSSALRHWSGYTDNYIRVIAESGKDLHNKLTIARLNALVGDVAFATVEKDPAAENVIGM
jgi:threonylcarbamoyladenosine tRNA methylthiotransferase MtaB